MSMRDLTNHLDDETLRRIVDVQAARLQLLQRELAKAEHDRDRYRNRLDDMQASSLHELRSVVHDYCRQNGSIGNLYGDRSRRLYERMRELTWGTRND